MFKFPPLIRAMIRGNERKEFDLLSDREIILHHIKEGWKWETPIKKDSKDV